MVARMPRRVHMLRPRLNVRNTRSAFPAAPPPVMRWASCQSLQVDGVGGPTSPWAVFFSSVSRTEKATTRPALRAAAPRKKNAALKLTSSDNSANELGLDRRPDCAMNRETPKNVPRANSGATSETSVCIDPASNDVERCTPKKAPMNAANGSPASPVRAMSPIATDSSNNPGTTVYLRPSRSMIRPARKTTGKLAIAAALARPPTVAGLAPYA